jgi:hypothetical protein
MGGHVKNIVYAEKIWNINHLKERIHAAIGNITLHSLQHVWIETEYHLVICHAMNGVHTEVY